MNPSMVSTAAALKQNPNLVEAVGNMWDNLTELSKTNPKRYLLLTLSNKYSRIIEN